MTEKELVDIEGELKGETEKAFKFYDGGVTEWLPKSQVEWHGKPPTFFHGTMVMPMWLAKEKGFV